MPPIAVIFGSGSNIGHATALKLKSEGFKVAVVARTIDADQARGNDLYPVTLDLSKPSSVAPAFDAIVKDLGVPTVIVYNAASYFLGSPEDPFSPSLTDLETSVAVNISSFYAVVQQFIEHGRTLPPDTQKTIFYTGNILNTVAMSIFVTLGVGKSAGAHIIAAGAASKLVHGGFRFYYVDERLPDGKGAYTQINGPAHAEIFSQLIKSKDQQPWNVLFVKPGKIVQF